VLVGNVGDVDGKADDYVVSNVLGGRLVPSSSGSSVCVWLGWIHVWSMCFVSLRGGKGGNK
jgi:hypothetical protein